MKCPYCSYEINEMDLHDELRESRAEESFDSTCPNCEKDIHVQVFIDVNFELS